MPDFGGGMENISATTMTDDALSDEIEALEGDSDGLVAHELAHQWFGDLLTCKDWSHLWLNEGFASYFDPLFTEHDRGEDAFRLEMDNVLHTYLGNDRGYRRPIVETRYESSNDMFDGVTYAKGSCVLHVLRGLLGDEAWWKGIRSYVADHQLQVVETDDFRKAMEAASGKDLKWFFDQWVYKAGHPELKIRWHYEDDDKTVRVKVEQTQKVDDQTPLFRLPTTLAITEDVGRTRRIPIVIDGASHEFVIPCGGPAQDGAGRPGRLADQGGRLPEVGGREPVPARECRVRARPARGRAGAGGTRRRTSPRSPGRCRVPGNARRPSPPVGSSSSCCATARKPTARPCSRRPRTPRRGSASRRSAAWPSSARRHDRVHPPRGLVRQEGSVRARRAALKGLVDWKVEDAPAAAGIGLEAHPQSTIDRRAWRWACCWRPRARRPASLPRSTAAPGNPPRCRSPPSSP